MASSRLKIQTYEEDDCFSGGYSYGQKICSNSTFNSDTENSENGGSVSVRDMIKRYDSQQQLFKRCRDRSATKWSKSLNPNQSNQSLMSKKSSYCRVSSFASLNNKSMLPATAPQSNGKFVGNNYCKNCNAYLCCQNRNRTSSQSLNNGNPNVDYDVVVGNNALSQQTAEFKDDFEASYTTSPLNARNIMQKNRLLAIDSVGEANCHPIDASYQSKTTIAKTASGVRIIIDIFFDQEQQCVNATDILGSRVETDIPHSRILNEFQQQTTAATNTTAATASATTCN